MPDAWRAYLEMALGLTEVPRKRAQKVVGDLANRGGATAAQLQGLVDDLMNTGMANREALTNIVRHEVDRALGMVGLATAEEVDELTTRVRDLERQLRQARATTVGDVPAGEPTTGGTRIERPAPVPRAEKKAVAKKAVKATPNAMPAAGTTPATMVANTARAASPDSPAKKATPAKANPAKAGPVKANPAKAGPVKAGPVKAGPVKAGPAKAGPVKAGPAKAGPVKQAATKKATAKSGPVEPTVPAGTAQAPTAPVTAAAAGIELPRVASADDAAVAGGEAGVPTAASPVGDAVPPAKKTAAKRAAAKKAPGRKPGGRTAPTAGAEESP